jgi:hypothetical protein
MMADAPKLPISPHAGEMPGRAEGGAVPPTYRRPETVRRLAGRRSMSPPSGLPAISPAWGEIGSFGGGA